MTTRPIITALIALAITPLAACGGETRPPTPTGSRARRRASRPSWTSCRARAARATPKTICREIFTADHAAKVAQAGGASCEAKAKQEIAVPEETIEVQGLLVNGSGATARVKEQTGKVSTLVFVKSGGDWRIDRIR